VEEFDGRRGSWVEKRRAKEGEDTWDLEVRVDMIAAGVVTVR
jgi:hypothetical protein